MRRPNIGALQSRDLAEDRTRSAVVVRPGVGVVPARDAENEFSAAESASALRDKILPDGSRGSMIRGAGVKRGRSDRREPIAGFEIDLSWEEAT
jgi:hypothetical protein